MLRYVLIFSGLCISLASVSYAETTIDASSTPAVDPKVAELQTKIDQRGADIKALEKEIAQYEGQISTLSSQANSLSSTIKSLDLTKKKLTAQIKLTEDKINAATIAIQGLSSQISDTEQTAAADRRSISSAFSLLNQNSSQSLPEIILSKSSISDTWDSLNKLGILTDELLTDISHLKRTKDTLNTRKTAKQQAQAELTALRAQLNGQQSAVASAVAEKNQLLADTKQSQSEYQRILNQKLAQKDAFEQEMMAYEESLHLTVTKGDIPRSGKGVLSYPVDVVHITQYFGNTAFSTANPQIYNGKGHTGVDFGVSIGTPIKAAMSGQVVGVANTDLYRGCQSYGKWIMIKHPNGLSTLYAHLSVQNVHIGDMVSTGSIIGYSGNTGYSTGPHLHFGVYATAGVAITKFVNSRNCKGATIPLADFSAYLNPLSYL
jgi:murein DD-endopeptidase MepM/ murein hydrolase activator NlpD